MHITRRTYVLLAVLAVVIIGLIIYWFTVGNPAQQGATPTATSTSPTTENGQMGGGAPASGAGNSGTPPTTKDNVVGYTTTTDGKLEVITSTLPGVSFVAPVNTDVKVVGNTLTVFPPGVPATQALTIQKTTGTYPDDVTFIRKDLDGTDIAFNALYNTPDSSDYNPGNNLNPGHVRKVNNSLIDSVPAVTVHITADAVNGSTPRDFYVTWVHTGIINWYLVRQSQGFAPPVQAILDTLVNSIRLIR